MPSQQPEPGDQSEDLDVCGSDRLHDVDFEPRLFLERKALRAWSGRHRRGARAPGRRRPQPGSRERTPAPTANPKPGPPQTRPERSTSSRLLPARNRPRSPPSGGRRYWSYPCRVRWHRGGTSCRETARAAATPGCARTRCPAGRAAPSGRRRVASSPFTRPRVATTRLPASPAQAARLRLSSWSRSG